MFRGDRTDRVECKQIDTVRNHVPLDPGPADGTYRSFSTRWDSPSSLSAPVRAFPRPRRQEAPALSRPCHCPLPRAKQWPPEQTPPGPEHAVAAFLGNRWMQPPLPEKSKGARDLGTWI